ncbi:MAG: zf-HC2 domain-containing protein [Candidatus Dormibacteria bacterium]
MKCSLLTLSCALDGELSKERQAELESHLVTCERCRTGMRYLREETERISQLVKVTVPKSTATALLERAKVITTGRPSEPGPAASQEDERAGDLAEPGLDPFNLMGFGTQAIEVADQDPELADDQAPGPSSPPPPTAGTAAGSDAGLVFVESEANAPSAGTTILPPADAPSPPPGDWLIPVTGTPQPAHADPPGTPYGTEDPASGSASVSNPEEVSAQGLSGTAPAQEPVPGDELGPPPVFVPLPGPLLEQDPGSLAEAADPELSTPEPKAHDTPLWAPPAVPEPSVWLPPEQIAPASETPDQAEMMQVALEESAILDSGESSPADAGASLPPPEVPPPPHLFEAAGIPPPPSILEAQAAGWQPNANLNLGLDDIGAAKPQLDSLAASADPAPPGMGVPTAGTGVWPARSDFTPVRPAAAAAAGAIGKAGSPAGSRAPGPRRPLPDPPRGRGRTPLGPGAASPRSWTKTATIAIAALAVFLIGWTLTHHSATTPARGSHVTTPSASKPTPANTPTPSTAPAITLSGTQSFGGSGSGYQVQNARYGLHQNGTQLWVVFQLGSGSGAPKITTGFDGAQTLYVEMQGVAAGTAVAQPPPGELVTSIQAGQVAGFSGAVYVLQLSRAAQVSGYLLSGSPTGPAGERVVLQLQ